MNMLASFFATNYALYARRQERNDLYNRPIFCHPLNMSTITTSVKSQMEQRLENERKFRARNERNSSSKEVKFSIENILSDKPLSSLSSDDDDFNVDDRSSHAEENMDEESGEDHSDMGQFSWLQCTRYKPPKLPRLKKKDGVKKRKLGRNPRVPFTQHQVAMLEQKFRRTHYLSSMDVAELSTALSLTETRVKIWFQNRRARERRDREAARRGQPSNSNPDTRMSVPNPPWVFSSSHSSFHLKNSMEMSNTTFSPMRLPN